MPEGLPQSLHLAESLANSMDVETGLDDLGTTEKARAWLVAHGLGEHRLRARDLERLRVFREGLRELLRANHGEMVEGRAVEALNAEARKAPVSLRFSATGEPSLEACAEGLDGVFAEVLRGIATAAAEGSWQRLKICRNDTCAVAFYDLSKNRSRSWCSMEVCGNRMKVKAFRERHAHDA